MSQNSRISTLQTPRCFCLLQRGSSACRHCNRFHCSWWILPARGYLLGFLYINPSFCPAGCPTDHAGLQLLQMFTIQIGKSKTAKNKGRSVDSRTKTTSLAYPTSSTDQVGEIFFSPACPNQDFGLKSKSRFFLSFRSLSLSLPF